MAKKGNKQAGQQVSDEVQIARNRRVHHDYEVLKTWVCGMVLSGSEVKSLRAGDVQWGDAHARLDDRGELWLYGLWVGDYRHAAGTLGHLNTQRRKLLLHRRELDAIAGQLRNPGLSLIPTRLYFKGGWAKIDLALGRGRKKGDKRHALAERARRRDTERELARRARGR